MPGAPPVPGSQHSQDGVGWEEGGMFPPRGREAEIWEGEGCVVCSLNDKIQGRAEADTDGGNPWGRGSEAKSPECCLITHVGLESSGHLGGPGMGGDSEAGAKPSMTAGE